MNRDSRELEASLDYQFSEPALLQQALTHRSVGKKNNERLEFIGDSVLGLVISTEIYERFPDIDEGELSRRRASLVRGDTLAEIARELSIGDYLNLGSGELKSGGFRRESILANTLEAIIGAVYLDSGTDAVWQLVIRMYKNRINAVSEIDDLKDPKTRLQEFLQARQKALPVYEIIDVTGNPPKQAFKVSCSLSDPEMTIIGEGSSRRKAEQEAAQSTLAKIEND
ncbi:MAG: ribonuclease III [Gammaproteobacteria bacterium]|nr:ribonuclease III [Gammaproteobacteria bacterium]MDH5593939.1 ribonuclease III [Gammaproteobacteria bacterium]